jgi:epoxyqueuosine reductase
MTLFQSRVLADAGLNMQAAFNIADLPEKIALSLAGHVANLGDYTQLLLIAHGGKRMWEGVTKSGMTSEHPVDDYSVRTVRQIMESEYPQIKAEFIYPGDALIGLRDLGGLAGWHHASPFRVGIHVEWGTWFAYRTVVLTDTNFTPTPSSSGPSPCDSCSDKPCIAVCPAKAVAEDDLNLEQCLDYRLQQNTNCADKCLSRLACPVGSEHRYVKEQLNYHYGRSLTVIRDYKRVADKDS